MIRLLMALAASLALTGCGEPAREWPAPSPALWEISGPDGERGWLFGTIHSLPDGVEWRTAAFDSALGDADVLVVEIADLGANEQARAALEARARSAGLPPLSERVGPEQRADLSKVLDRAGLRASQFDEMETWAASLMIGSASRTSEPANGVDRALIATGKPRQALESYAGQFDIFDRLPESAQRSMLRAVMDEATCGCTELQIVAWLTGDLDALARETDEFLADRVLREGLLTARNLRWTPEIEHIMADGRKPLVAVGAGHMLGADGLPALLAARGYAVRRVQ